MSDLHPALDGRAPQAFDLTGVEHVLVLVAHPDDETLAVGGLLADLPDATDVDLVVASDGQASHPRSTTHTPEDLRRLRREELARATAHLAPDARTHLLGHPDGGLSEHVSEIVDATVPLVRPGATLLISTYGHDGHPDHEAVARAAAAIAWRTDAHWVEAPIWWWVRPGDVAPEPERLRAVALSAEARGRKARAIAEHVSQVRPLSDLPGDEVILPEEVLTHFRRDHEVVILGEPGETSPFEALHEEHRDPWQVHESWYERRKRALTLALLPRERYALTLELGCSIGRLAEDLATRSDRVLAVDEAGSAVRTAARAGTPTGAIEVLQARLPEEWDRLPGGADLVVVSELGYFLSPARLRTLAHRISSACAPDATVLACHWRHEIVGWPLRGDDVHRLLDAELPLPLRSHLVEDDVVLSVWSR